MYIGLPIIGLVLLALVLILVFRSRRNVHR
jgi:LPXTG-motif cell wall-anchored protein